MVESKKGETLKGILIPALENVTVPDDMNREQRRAMKKGKRVFRRKLQDATQQIGHLENIGEIIDEERDILELGKDLYEYERAQDFSKTCLQYFRLLRDCGVSEETARQSISSDPDDKNDKSAQQLLREMDPTKMRKYKGQFSSLERRLIHSKPYSDEEDETIAEKAVEVGLSVEEIYSEIMRARRASIDLIRMQIDYIRAKEEMQRKMDEEIRRQKAQDEQLAEMIAEEERQKDVASTEEIVGMQEAVGLQPAETKIPFPLADWNIYWTDRFWSDNPNHLTKIDTTSQESAAGQVEKVGGGQISVRVGSVIRALEFHLHDRDKIQRALATRNKYAPEEIRRWVKVKRGKDRIGILVDEDRPNTAIFFVGGRDVVYRGL